MHPIPHRPERTGRIPDWSGSVSGYGRRAAGKPQDASTGGGSRLGELAVPVVLLFSLGHQPVAHLVVGLARHKAQAQVAMA